MILRDLRSAALAVLACTAALGVLYPLAVTGIARVAIPAKASGDPSLVAAAAPGRPDRFQPRPSVTGYRPDATAFNNRGPNQRSLAEQVRGQLRAYLARERPASPALTADQVPASAVTTSGSGVDPHIEPADARIQARRVARARRLPVPRVLALVEEHTDATAGGLVGDPGVNVTDLNAALDAGAR